MKDAYDENMYTEMMRELRDNPDTRDLYYDIVTLSILQGTYQSAVSIKNVIPVEDFSDIIKPIIDTLQSTPEVQLFSNGMFQRNNWKDEAIVPTITPFFRASEEPVGMILVGNEEEEVFKYSSPSFPKLPAFGIKDTDRRVLLLSETYNSEAVQYDFVKVPRGVKTRTRWNRRLTKTDRVPKLTQRRVSMGDRERGCGSVKRGPSASCAESARGRPDGGEGDEAEMLG